MSNTYILRKGIAELSDLKDGGAAYGYPGDYPGRVYYVNNITGLSSYDGLTWEHPFDEISTAVTASEAYRQLQGTDTNDYVRNIIYVQGTGTPYTALTALPSYCDIVGVGADPRGNGAGIARVGADSGTGEYGVLAAGTARGLNVYNMQFQAGKDAAAFKCANLYRCVFENCAFGTNGIPAGDPTAAFEVGKASGLVLRNCHTINASSESAFPCIGLYVTGTHFHNSLVENCYIAGSTAAINIASTCVNGFGSMVKDCYLGWGGETCAIGVDDNATDGHIVYAGCFVFATDAFDLAHNGTGRMVGCTKANAFTT